jgi:hypothetical protein
MTHCRIGKVTPKNVIALPESHFQRWNLGLADPEGEIWCNLTIAVDKDDKELSAADLIYVLECAKQAILTRY